MSKEATPTIDLWLSLLTKEQEELSLKPINRGIIWRAKMRECRAKNARNIRESELSRATSSGCHCSAAKRKDE
jgi:hypothetical protein